MFNSVKEFLDTCERFSTCFIGVNSRGGELDFGQKIAQLIIEKERDHCVSVYMIAGERVSSSALLPYIAGMKRLALKRTKFLFHHARNGTKFATKNTYKKIEVAEKNCVSFMAKKIKVSEDCILNLMDNKIELDFDEALSLGLVTGFVSDSYYHSLIQKQHLS